VPEERQFTSRVRGVAVGALNIIENPEFNQENKR
jgi:hypothetical protein